MIKSESEIWRSLPGIPGVEVSTFGNVRTLDRVVSSENRTRFTKGKILKQYDTTDGYLQVSIPVDGKWTSKKIHRLIAQTFIPNPDSLPEINHKDNNPLNNNVSNLEWCTREYNIAYREKYGKPAKESVPKSPVYAVNLKTKETLWFEPQMEAGRVLGVSQGNIGSVIRGNRKQTGGYWFTSADSKTYDLTSHKH